MNNQDLAKKILELVGGNDNVNSVTNCMTRVRFKIKDDSKVEIATLKDTEGVLGIVEDETLQVVVGPGKAKRVADVLIEELNVPSSVGTDWEDNKKAVKGQQKQSGAKDLLRVISNIFIPLLPAIIAAGLFSGFASLLKQLAEMGVISGAETSYWTLFRLFLSLLGAGFLSYFAIFTGINAAKQFGATEALGGIIGAVSIAPGIIDISTFFNWYNAESPLNSILTTGKGGIIGVIIGVFLLAKVEKAIRKRVPEVLDLIVTPMISLLIVGAAFVFVIMPLSGIFSDWLVAGLNVIINSSNPVIQVLSGFLLSALFLPMVLLGLHHGLIPIYAIQLETLGGVTLFPVLAMAGAGQVGAAIAIYIKAKQVGNKKMLEIISGAMPAGILGVGEPLIYGVTLPLGKPFITAGIGAGFGGAFVMLTHVMASAWGPSGVVAIPLMGAGPNGAMGMLYYAIGLVISYVAAFLITFFVIKKEDVAGAV